MTRLAIIGPGLLGGSIALAAEQKGNFDVAIWARRTAVVEQLHKRGFKARASTELSSVVEGAELIVLCVPIGAMQALAREMVPRIAADCVITDVGSVKASVVAELGAIFRERGRFVGSHPMAGSERSGLEAARADLFEGATCIVTPETASPVDAVLKVADFWRLLGMEVLQLTPGDHDQIVALVSHLPHLLAATLVNTVLATNPRAFDFCGPGFRDVTRVASGPAEMWSEILHTNHEAIRKCAEAMIENLRGIVTLLERPQPMTDFLSEAKAQRDLLRPCK
jgi:prephenate dehydrogenase